MAESMTAWGYPSSRPFILLLVYYLIATLQLSTVAAWSPLPGTNSRAIWAIAAAAFGLAMALRSAWARWAGFRDPGSWSPRHPAPRAVRRCRSRWAGSNSSRSFYLAVLGACMRAHACPLARSSALGDRRHDHLLLRRRSSSTGGSTVRPI
ncbi:MAG: hypothetical protein U0R64_10850 [Candidatus Nanopelagicales bacterium]